MSQRIKAQEIGSQHEQEQQNGSNVIEAAEGNGTNLNGLETRTVTTRSNDSYVGSDDIQDDGDSNQSS